MMQRRIIWLALVISPLMLLYILRTTTFQNEPISTPIEQYYLIAGVVFIGSFIFVKFLKKQINTAGRGTPDQREILPNIIQWALFNSVAVLGFIVGMQTHDISKYYPFLGLSMLGFIITFPKKLPEQLN